MSKPLLRRIFSMVSLGVSLRARVVIGTILPVVGIFAYFLYSYASLQQLATLTGEILERRVVLMRSADQIKQGVLGYDDSLFRYLALGDPTHLTRGLQTQKRILSLIQEMEAVNPNPILDERLALLYEEASLFFQDAESLLAYVKKNSMPLRELQRQSLQWVRQPKEVDLHFAFLSEEGRSRMVRVNDLCDEILTINRLELDRARTEMQGLLARARHTAIVLSVLATLAILLTGFGFAMALLYPLRDLLEGIRQVEKGQLDIQIPVTTQDEVGEITQAFNVAARTILEQREQLLRETITDGLTGAFNQRHFRKLLKQEVERSRRTEAPLSLLMIDIDHFKSYNDTFGHEFGNEVLKRVVRLVREQLREMDQLARYGGDELAVLAPNTGPEHAKALATRILDAIGGATFVRPETMLAQRLTTSIGGASYPQEAASVEELVRRADEALYLAKQKGRARVYWTGEDAPVHQLPA